MFSRFDNMMQHTHTHNRTKKKELDDKKSIRSISSNASVCSMPNTPITEQKPYIGEHHRILPRSEYMYYGHLPPPSPTKSQHDDDYHKHYYWNAMYFQPSPVSPTYTKKISSPEGTLSVSNTKLSVELSTPIQQITNESLLSDCCSSDEEDSVCSQSIQITPDEFEALQGFGKFCSEPIIREPFLMTRITTSPSNSISYPIKLPPLNPISVTAVLSNSPVNSQVNAFRQQISPIHESFQRPVRNGAL